MDSDALLVLGLVLAWLGIPAMFSAYADRRSPITAVAMLLFGGALVAWAALSNPGGYQLAQLPEVFFGVIGRFF